MITSYHDAVSFLDSLIPSGDIKRFPGELGLTRQREIMRRLGNPQDAYPIIHITGTSGKGSTSYFIANILKHAGYTVGLHTSPHITKINERVQINGNFITDSEFVQLVKEVQRVVEDIRKEKVLGVPTYFEALVAMAFLAFQKNNIDIAVVEVGMGGKFDGTNIVTTTIVSVVTNVGLDHTQFLGDTVEKIIVDKREIIKPSVDVVSGVTQETVKKLVIEKCKETNSKLFLLGKDIRVSNISMDQDGEVFDVAVQNRQWERLHIHMLGSYQVDNAALAIAACVCAQQHGFSISKDAVKKGLSETMVPGRMEVVGTKPYIVLDGAHNEDKMKALTGSFSNIFSYNKLIVVFGLKENKDAHAIISYLAPIVGTIIVTQFTIGSDMGLHLGKNVEELAKEVRLQWNGKVLVERSPIEALKKARILATPNDAILVTGSLYLVSELRGFLNNHSTF